MSRLRILAEHAPDQPLLDTREHALIAERLGEIGVRFERWQANAELPEGASQEQTLAAYREDIDRLMREGGYRSVDVVSLHPQHPDREALRRKFLDEHTHNEDEVRFFVAGSGLFTLHIDDRVFEVLCERGDLIAVPDGTRHWFDMGPEPFFIAIRIFGNPDGWVARFTGEPIAERFSRFDAVAGTVAA
ncbi:MAG: cupin [Lysobacteraceae bacterium]|jgi:1,2-dihydroxy-3-keto-5-methylthiopentene dioxygenase